MDVKPSEPIVDRDSWFQLRAVIYPAGDSSARWKAHVLETEVTTEADSIDDAIEMLDDLLGGRFAERAERGLFPVRLRPAPPEVWNLLGTAEPVEYLRLFVTCLGAAAGHPKVYPVACYVSRTPRVAGG